MHIIVPIKQVPETKSVRMDEENGTVIREGIENIVNPLDLYAVEAALSLKEETGGTVTAISMGPPKASAALKEVIAMGVDYAVLISDKSFAGSDTLATASILGEAVRTLDTFNMIICGERATDGDTGQVGPMLAQYLELPLVSYVSGITEVTDKTCTLRRMVENGTEELETEMPCLITVVKDIGEPRLPTLDGKIKARKTNIPTIGLKELPFDCESVGLRGSPTKVVKIFRPELTRHCRTVVASDDETIAAAAAEFAKIIRGKGVRI